LDNQNRNIVKNIAEELDCGFDCYFNFKTKEIITIPGSSEFYDIDDFKEAFEENFKKIETQKDQLIKFESLKGYESYQIMERFVEIVPDKFLQSKLREVLSKKKPFRNFKNWIDHSNFRQNWFDFKLREIEKIVETKLSRIKPAHNNGYE